MMPARQLMDHVLTEPFQPFTIHTASGRTFDVRHPEFVNVGKTTATVYSPTDNDPNGPQRWEKLSLVLVESISPLGASIASSGK